MEENKFLLVAVVALLVLHFALLTVSVGAQLYFGPKLKSRSADSTPLKGHQPVP